VVNMFATGHLSMPSMYIFWQAAWLKLFGDNMVGLRLPWALVGTLSILGAYLLVRRLFNRGLALVVALLLAGYHYHLHYSRLGLNNIADPFFVVWALCFLVVGWQGNKRWAWALSGVLAGLAFFFYTGGRQVPVILAGVVLWAALTERDFLTRSRAGLVALAIGFLVAFGPMALFAVQHPDDFNARVNQIGVIQSGWLEREATILGQSTLQVMADQFRKVFFAFNIYRDRSDFYKPAIPLMDFAPAVLFLLGLVLSVARLVQRPHGDAQTAEGPDAEKPVWRYSVFVIWFFVVIITGGVLTESAPSSQRILSAAVPAIFFVATALWELTLVLAGLLKLPAVGHLVLVGMLAVVLTAGSLSYYFGDYQRSWVYGSANGEVATRIGHYLRDLGPDWQEYFFGAPRMYADFGSTSFLAKGVRLYDVSPGLASPPKIADPSRKAVFVFLPERAKELTGVQQAYPGGVLEEVRRVGEPNGPLLFIAYKVASQ
jgi:4-amino-4-deoxy-L-arabinose transferase-like glycosyltransferase